MNIKVIGTRVLVKKDDIDSFVQTTGGVFIPKEAAQAKFDTGTVLAVGDGHLLHDGTREPLGVNVGDRVFFDRFGGTEVKIDGVTYQVLIERDILGIILDERE